LIRPPRNPLWSVKARRIGGPGILGLDGRDVEWDAELWRTAERQIDRLLNRLRRGRPRAEYHLEWAQSFQRLWAEAVEEHELNCVDGERPPSKIAICYEIAIDDFRQNPDRFKRDPAGRLRKDAGRTVWKAVKPLV
jgi:hypothetical protein